MITEISKIKNISLQSLFDEFIQIPYSQKLTLFHSFFGIVPFPFPNMDTDISWFYNKEILTMLTDNLSEEIKNNNLYEKLETENENSFVFDIKPKTYSQRIAYNNFLLTLFSSEPYTLELELPHGYLNTAEEYLSFLIAKRWRMNSILTETKEYLQNRGNFKSDFKHQFVKVFYSGFASFRSKHSINLRVRHKFVEMYLYSQGQAIAGYLEQLQGFIDNANIIFKATHRPSC